MAGGWGLRTQPAAAFCNTHANKHLSSYFIVCCVIRLLSKDFIMFRVSTSSLAVFHHFSVRAHVSWTLSQAESHFDNVSVALIIILQHCLIFRRFPISRSLIILIIARDHQRCLSFSYRLHIFPSNMFNTVLHHVSWAYIIVDHFSRCSSFTWFSS